MRMKLVECVAYLSDLADFKHTIVIFFTYATYCGISKMIVTDHKVYATILREM